MTIRFNVGGDNFRKLRETNGYYVDKTHILYELVEQNNEVTLFTRPRRFGKTLMVSMMENFFNIQKDSKDIFDGLDIMRHTEFCDEYMNKYPVIFLTLKSVEGENFEAAYEELENVIAKFCKGMTNIENNDRVDPYDKDIFDRLKHGTASKSELKNSIDTITRILYSIYGKNVIVLIDEYDVPIAKAYSNGYYSDMLVLIRGFLNSALKTNEFLKFAVLTGCLRVSKESIFTDVNHFKVFSILDKKFSTYFGFTDPEVKDIFDKINHNDKLPIAKEWYDGYRFWDTHIYCPWDVLNYACDLLDNENLVPQNYWANTSSNDIIKAFVRRPDLNIVKKQFERLLNGEVISIIVNNQLNYDILTSSADNIWSILLMTGYITPSAPITSYNSILVKLPNREICNIFEETVVEYFNDTLDTTKQTAMIDALWNGDEDTASQYMSSLLNATISYNDYHEDYYHAFIAGIFSGIGNLVESNRESGVGRADIIVYGNGNNKAIILETKKADKEELLDKACDAAIKQIIDKKYASGLTSNYKDIVCYGVGFYQKTAKVKLLKK